MKTILIVLEDEEYKLAIQKKGTKTWKGFLLGRSK